MGGYRTVWVMTMAQTMQARRKRCWPGATKASAMMIGLSISGAFSFARRSRNGASGSCGSEESSRNAQRSPFVVEPKWLAHVRWESIGRAICTYRILSAATSFTCSPFNKACKLTHRPDIHLLSQGFLGENRDGEFLHPKLVTAIRLLMVEGLQ